MTTKTKHSTYEYVDQLFTSDDVCSDIFVSSSNANEQKELGSINRPEVQPLPPLVSPTDVVAMLPFDVRSKQVRGAAPFSLEVSKLGLPSGTLG